MATKLAIVFYGLRTPGRQRYGGAFCSGGEQAEKISGSKRNQYHTTSCHRSTSNADRQAPPDEMASHFPKLESLADSEATGFGLPLEHPFRLNHLPRMRRSNLGKRDGPSIYQLHWKRKYQYGIIFKLAYSKIEI